MEGDYSTELNKISFRINITHHTLPQNSSNTSFPENISPKAVSPKLPLADVIVSRTYKFVKSFLNPIDKCKLFFFIV